MKIATITEAKNKLSALLDRVRAGETILIVDRGRPVARLEPAVALDERSDGRLARLERAGLVRVGGRRGRASLLDGRPPRTRTGVNVVDALVAERRTGR